MATADDRPRNRGADLVEEARIAQAGGGVRRISVFYQALLYVLLVGALLFVVWWVSS